MTNREIRKLKSDLFNRSCAWSFSVEKASEMTSLSGLSVHSADAVFATRS